MPAAENSYANTSPLKILHAAAECYPLAKTGGLGDVIGALAPAQRRLNADVRVALPGYRGLASRLEFRRTVAAFELHGHEITVTEGTLDRSDSARARLPVYLFENAELYDRPGDPYRDEHGVEFPDNGQRFGCFSEALARFVLAREGFAPQLVHLHDWQAGLAAGWLRQPPQRPATLLSIHNLAYQGVYDRALFDHLGCPPQWWTPDGMEFWGRGSFLKAGIQFADAVSTVSPGYAEEIRTPAFGCGLETYLKARGASLRGIVNGVDTAVWDPRSDPMIAVHYGVDDVATGKAANKTALLRELDLPDSGLPLIAFIGRLADQKGADLIAAAGPELLKLPAQYVLLASGEAALERAFREFEASAPPGRVRVRIAHDEVMAHQLTAAADALLMPSRYEPCGLNQMYAQRYGTVPVVRRTGGLADTVTDASPEALAEGRATGVQFNDADVGGLLYGVRRVLELLADESARNQLRSTGMARDFSWEKSAREYLDLYTSLLR